jgi:NADH:ubiquinone oxidoreductase subunit C
VTLTETQAPYTTADGISTLDVPLEQLTATIDTARREGYDRFVDLTAVDLLSRQNRFQLVYVLYSMSQHTWLRIKTRTDAEAPSLTATFPAVNWYERELFDLFGLRFEGHPDLQRIMLPDDWQGYPLRRTEPLGAEPVDFTVTRSIYGRD